MRIYPSYTQDAEFQALGALGFVGNLNDRQFAYLGDRGFPGRSLTDRFGQRSSPYAANDYYPSLVTSFEKSFYGNGLTFDDLFTHSRAGNATMIDESGLVKWAPHNLRSRSDDLDNWATKENVVVSSNIATLNSGTSTKRVYHASITGVVAGTQFSYEFHVEAGTHGYIQIHDGSNASYWANFDISSGVVGTVTGCTATITTHASGGYVCKIVLAAATTSILPVLCFVNSTTASRNPSWNAAGTETVTFHTATAYRSDLGGMADVPADARVAGSTTYVPTAAAAVYLPRIGYVSRTSGRKGVLLEPAATNLITYSEDFTDAYWATGSSNIGALALDETGPDGAANSAVTLVDSGATGTGAVYIQRVVTVSTSTTYTFSIFAKADQIGWIEMRGVTFTTPANGGVNFDLTNGVVGAESAGFTGHIENWGNGWYRCAITFTTDAADTSGTLRIYATESSGSLLVDLDGTSSILIFGAQFEAGSVPTSYIPTAGATAARAADVIYVPAANIPAYTTALSMALEGEITYADNGVTAEATPIKWTDDASNQIVWYLDTAGGRTGAIQVRQYESGVVDLVISEDTTYSPGVNVPISIASWHTSTGINGAVDGVALTENSTPTALADLSSADLYLAYSGGPMLLFNFRFWADKIGNTGIAEAS